MKKLLAEFIGTCFLVCAVVGSGIMATDFTQDVGLQLLINAVATVAALHVLITIFGEISGAHFNPLVSLFAWSQNLISKSLAVKYSVVQIVGAICGAELAELMFNSSLGNFSQHTRSGSGLWLSEVVATAGLILIISFAFKDKINPKVTIPAWIGAGYLFTSSTIFANPAVTIGRSFTDSFAGIHPNSIFGFIIAQFLGLIIGAFAANLFHKESDA